MIDLMNLFLDTATQFQMLVKKHINCYVTFTLDFLVLCLRCLQQDKTKEDDLKDLLSSRFFSEYCYKPYYFFIFLGGRGYYNYDHRFFPLCAYNAILTLK